MTTEQDKDQRLDQAIARLPRELLPEQDLWLQLEPQLQPHSARHNRFTGQVWAAAAALALVGVLIWRAVLVPGGTDNTDRLEWMLAEQVLIEEFEAIKADKLGNVGKVSEYYGDWTYQLAVWDDAIGQVREALYYYPDEPVLLSQMQGLYQQQLGYLQQISAVDTNDFSWMGNEP